MENEINVFPFNNFYSKTYRSWNFWNHKLNISRLPIIVNKMCSNSNMVLNNMSKRLRTTE